MDEEPFYVQLLAYVALLMLVLTMIGGLYYVLRGSIDTEETRQMFDSYGRNDR